MVQLLYQNDKVHARKFFTFLDIYQNGKNAEDSAMTNAEIRRENARWLAQQCGGNARFAEIMELEESRVSHLIGKNPVKNIGTATARKIEVAFEKPTGWLDIPSAWKVEAKSAESYLVTLNPEDLARLIYLFGKATSTGKSQILRMAESAQKESSDSDLKAANH